MGWGWLLCSISGRTRTQGTRLSSGEEARCSGTGGFSSVQSISLVRLFVSPRTAAHQASLSITNSQSLLKLMSIGGLLLAIGSLKCFYVCYCMCYCVLCVYYCVCVLLSMCVIVRVFPRAQITFLNNHCFFSLLREVVAPGLALG